MDLVNLLPPAGDRCDVNDDDDDEWTRRRVPGTNDTSVTC
jgi:hypothetical protein